MDNRIFCTDSAKAIKAESYGYLNAIQYLAPSTFAGVGDVCPKRSPVCTQLCLGWFAGHAGIGKVNNVRRSRIQKTRRFMRDRQTYLADVVLSIARLKRYAATHHKKLCVRLNGSSDIAWEMIRVGTSGKSIFEIFPETQFVDYTKIAKRFDRALPANYHLTFSRSETNESEALQLLERGFNVAVVFKQKPLSWQGHIVVDGDTHDLRHLDPRAEPGCAGYVIALQPKGSRAKRDTQNFVVQHHG